jgi:hypothetical protein
MNNVSKNLYHKSKAKIIFMKFTAVAKIFQYNISLRRHENIKIYIYEEDIPFSSECIFQKIFHKI